MCFLGERPFLFLGLLSLVTGCTSLRRNERSVALCNASAEEAFLGEEILFDGSASFDPDGAIVAYDWYFGDQSRAMGAVVSHAYTAAGEYMVRLNVRDDRGAVAKAEKKITVQGLAGPEEPILVAFTVPADVVAPFVDLTFDASPSRARDGELVEYLWHFGDGGEDEGEIVVYSNIELGIFSVRLTVRDSLGREATAEKRITVIEPPEGNRPPLARFTWMPREPRVGQEVVFDARGSTDDGAIVQYWWDFGDGGRATGPLVRHVFQEVEVYEVFLLVVDNFGEESGAEVEINVR